MLKVGLIGFGSMGRFHFDVYKRLESEGAPVKLTAICDIDASRFTGNQQKNNLDSGSIEHKDLSQYKLYTNFEAMLEQESLDFIDITLPTYLHPMAAISALQKGIHVLCEKPMALHALDAARMMEAARSNGCQLMIAHCLRFYPEYEYLKSLVDDGVYGRVISAYFFRHCSAPNWTYQNWMLKDKLSGGSLLDLHIHDTDMINWLFGQPESVSSIAKNAREEGGYDLISTHYCFPDGKLVHASADSTFQGDYAFSAGFKVNFERGSLVFEKKVLEEYPSDRGRFTPQLSKENGYYREIKYFVEMLETGQPMTRCTSLDSYNTIGIAEMERLSADRGGQMVHYKN